MPKATLAPQDPAELQAVEDYIDKLTDPALTHVVKMRELIRAAAPKAATECISYAMPAFRYHSILVYYAASKQHCALYPGNAALLASMEDELAGYSTSKGTIRFPLDKPLPAALIKRIVKARAKQNEEKIKAK